MKPSVSAPIDIVLDKVNALIEVTEAKGVPEDCVQRYYDAYMDFDEDSDVMTAAMVDLKVIRYPGVKEICGLAAMVRGASMQLAKIGDLYAGQSNSPYFYGMEKKPWAKVRSDLLRWLRKLQQALLMARAFCSDAQKRRKPKRKRASDKPRKPRPPTLRQLEVIQIVGECIGNLSAAARKLGRDRKTIEGSYRAGMMKLGKTVYNSKDKTRLLARDRRGQATVSEDDDRRR